jgi:hypothetical protein
MADNKPKAPNDWIEAYAKVTAAMATRISDEVPAAVRELLIKSTGDNWSAEKDIYVFGSLPIDEAIEISKEKSFSWLSFRGFLAKASFGDLQGMRKFYEAMEDEHKKGALDSAYSVIFNSDYSDDRRRFSAEIIEQITAWGLPLSAERVMDNPTFLQLVKAEQKAMLMKGFATKRVLEIMEDRAKAGDSDVFSLFQEEMKNRDGAAKMDDQRLVTMDYEPSREGLGKLKKIFDFHAGRVMEIYQPPGSSQQVMASVSFEEYNRNVIEEARETLIFLKGDPDSATPFVRKKTLGAGVLKLG